MGIIWPFTGRVATAPSLPAPIWKGSPNFWPGRPGPPIAIVIHTMSGTLAGTDSWFGQSVSQVSAHTGVGLQAQRHRYVDFHDRAWANGIIEPGNKWASTGQQGNPNDWTLSIETEDNGVATTPVSDLEYDAVLQECLEMLALYPHIRWLLKHADISPSSRANCPGDRWVKSGKFALLASTLSLATL